MIYGIVCCDQAGGIGKEGKIPWHSKRDLKHFKHITNGSTVIMGRKTWDSLPVKPLPGRSNLVISNNEGMSLNEAKLFLGSTSKDVFVMGGGQIYKALENFIQYWYITVVKGDYGCDTKLFIDLSKFEKQSEIVLDSGSISFKEYSKI